MKKAIIGNGGFSREIQNELPNARIFVSDDYYNGEDGVSPLSEFDPAKYECIVAVGDPVSRFNIVQSLPKETQFFTFISKDALILGPKVYIGDGSIICAGVVVTTNIRLGMHTHLNLNSTIGHDTVIGEFFTTAPGVHISGNNKIGRLVYFGTNSCTREKVQICDDVIIGLNAGVVKNITEPGVYIGTPAIKIK